MMEGGGAVANPLIRSTETKQSSSSVFPRGPRDRSQTTPWNVPTISYPPIPMMLKAPLNLFDLGPSELTSPKGDKFCPL
jgi:hypothetical protein